MGVIRMICEWLASVLDYSISGEVSPSIDVLILDVLAYLLHEEIEWLLFCESFWYLAVVHLS